ncbi:urease accessory protein UreF [Marinobacter vinifirmus]|jgi:urease accessory protein|uniref:Urease accessory protein UreF n=2 Tax=Marinobacteraceae TaxID=2887365 RepID=A0A7Z1DRY8_9GAMM|nr:urease accessory protein UreF [Marinobacter vinifirmus]|tara:strand:+ start:6674 stop:7408 length:735 start_codon:yes stop_codon:yes gene_type:complete
MVPIVTSMTNCTFDTHASSVLALMQLSDSALPIGRHAHAFGLERLFRDGRVETPQDLQSMITSALTHGVARADGAAAALAHDALGAGLLSGLLEIDARLDLLKLTASSQAASRRCGSRLASLAPAFHANSTLVKFVQEVADKKTPGHVSVVSGAVAAAMGISREDAVLMELRGVVTMILSAAVRLDVIPASAAQAMLVVLAPEIIGSAGISLGTGIGEMECGAAAGLEIASMRHARDHSRLFAT